MVGMAVVVPVMMFVWMIVFAAHLARPSLLLPIISTDRFGNTAEAMKRSLISDETRFASPSA